MKPFRHGRRPWSPLPIVVALSALPACIGPRCAAQNVESSITGALGAFGSALNPRAAAIARIESVEDDDDDASDAESDSDSGPSALAHLGAKPIAPVAVSWTGSSGVYVASGAQGGCARDAPCVLVQRDSDLLLRWDLPPSAGAYSLAEMNAELCENVDPDLDGETLSCTRVDGTLTVHAVTAPCSISTDDVCGAIDADVVLTMAPSTTQAYAYGEAHVGFAVTEDDARCGDSDGCGKPPSCGIE